MSHILRDLVNQAPFKVDWRRLIWSHFHAFAKKQAIEAGLTVSQERTLDDSDAWGVAEAPQADPAEIFNRVLMSEDRAPGYEVPKFGAIYVDEGQDFKPEWLDALAGFLEPEGELVLFADHRQNIYGQDGGCDHHRTSMARTAGVITTEG